MDKIRYYYNTHTLRFEKVETPFRVKLLRTLGFLFSSTFLAALMFAFTFRYVDSPKQKLLRQENDDLRDNYKLLCEKANQLELKVNEFENRDNNIYRSIFEATPIPDSARVKDMENKKELKLVNSMDENTLVRTIANQLDTMTLRSAYLEKSYGEIELMVKNKAHLLAAIPAIQPISNKQLEHIASGFGYRIDPVYKVTKMHQGLDFAAPQGTPIYATADGVVKSADYNGGYGNHVVIDHGFGYETLYGHMVRTKARSGENIKRGEIIGWVGSTGKSTGPHCHYEVHHGGVPVDPIYYFYNDISPAQFDRMIKIAKTGNQSFD